MSGLSIHEKRQLAERLAREQLSKSGQYRFGIPQSVLNAKANEFMRLSDKEIQQKFNEYFQSTGLNAKPKDLWDSMGLNLEQKKKAEAHMKGLQKQINKKYMRPATSNKKKTGAKQAKNMLPNDVKKEIRQFMVALLKQAFNQKSEEFRNYLLNNKGGFAEGAMELHDLGSAFADKLTEIGIVVDRGDTRAEIREKLIKKQAEIDVLESYVDDEKSFNELFQKYFNEDFDYRSTFDYICASSEFTTQDSAKKIEKFNKKIDGLTKTNLKSADDYMGNASGAGGLMDLAFNVALMYVSGGSSAIGKYAQMTAKGGTELAENAITKVAGKKLAQSSAGQAMSQGVGIVAAQTTSAGLNAVAFQGTKTAELAGETLATGEIDIEKAKNIVASAEGLFKFGYVGGAISGPLGMQVKGLTTKLLNSKPIINQILTKGITSRPAPLTSVLKDISEHSEAIGEVLKFGTEFGINAGYMAYDEGVSYTDAMKNLAQMDGVSKMVIAMLGGKNLEFLTPKKVQQIKTDLAGYKVNIAIYEGQKVYSVKDAKGKETVLATPEELFMFILDKEAQSVGVKVETAKADNTLQQNTQGAREQSGVRASEVEEVAPFAKRLLKSPTVEDLTNPEIKTVKLENGEFNEQGEFVSDGTYTKAETPFGKKETYRTYSDGDKKLATTVEELALQYAHYCGREKAVESDINAVEALLRGKDVTPQDVSEIIFDFNHATEGRENYNDGILSWKGLKTVKDLKTFKTNIREFDKFMTEMKASNVDSEVLYSLRNLRMDFMSESLSQLKPEEFKKNLETYKNLDSEIQKGSTYRESTWLLNQHSSEEFANLEVANEFNKWIATKRAEGKENLPYFTSDAFSFARLSQEKVAQAKQNVELVKEMVEGGSTNLNLMCEILTDSYNTSLYTDLNAKMKSELGDKYNVKDFDKIFLSAYNDRGNYNFDFGIQFAKNYPNGFKHFGAYQINKMAEKFAKLDKSAQEDMIAKLTILGKFPKFCEIEGKLQELSFDRFMSNEIPDAKNIADYINKSTVDSFKNFDFERYSLTDIQGFVKARQVGDSFDSKYTDTLLSMKLQRSDSEKAEILELAKIDKEFVNELLASKIGHKDYKPVYFRDKAIMDKLDGKTTETKSDLKTDYDRVYNEYTVNDMQLLVEAKNIDEDMTRELMYAVSDDGYGRRRRFTPEQISQIVKYAQADKAFAREIINETITNHYRFDSETVTAILENISTCKDFMKEIINAKNSDKSSYRYGEYEYTNTDITNLAKSAKIDAKYTRELLNTYVEDLMNEIYKRFSPDGILNIIIAGQNNKELMKKLVNSSKESSFDKTQDAVYNAKNIVQILNFEKNVEDKAFVKDIFADKEFTQNGLARVAETLNYRRDTEFNTLFKELFYDKEMPNKCIPGIIDAVNKDNISLLNKLKSNSDFPKNRIASVLQVTYKENIELAEQLCTDKDFPIDYINEIVFAVNARNKECALELCSNKEIPPEHLSRILSLTNQSNSEAVIDFCKTYKNYGFSADRIIDFVPHLKDINFENMQTLRTKISENAYQKMSASDFVILTNNMALVGKTSVESLLKSEKYNLINILLANKSKICEDKLLNIKEASPIFPTNETEYAERMKELSDSLNISFDKLTPEKQAKFDSSIGSLSNGVKEMNLADLSEINLKYSQKDFVNDINELLKDLSVEEQIKLQNKFGFRIIDNKLTGYPKTVKDLNVVDFENKELLNKVNEKVNSFLNNNALTVKDNPQLNSLLNDLFNICPEILNQIDGTVEFAKTVKRLQTIVNREEFKTLSDSDKKIIELAILVENTDKSINISKDAAFDAFFIGQKYGLSDNEAKKLYYIVEAGSSVETFMQTTKDTTVRKYRTSQITGQDRQDKFDMMALNLKEDNRLKMTQMLYSSKYPKGFTRNFDKALENRINEIKSQDFILPQTPSETYQEYATPTEIKRGDNKYNVNTVKAKDIPNLYAFVHTPEAGYATGGTRAANFANFEAFATLNDDKVICTSYVSTDKAGLVHEFGKGFIFEIQNDKQYVAYGRDIYSLGKNIPDIVVEYYRDKGFKANQNKGEKYDHRTLMSNIMKRMLFGKDYYQMSKDVITVIDGIKTRYDSKLQELNKQRQSIIKNTFGTDNITNAQYRELKLNVDFVNIEKQMKALRNQEVAEIENIPEYKELKDMDNKYIARLDNVKAKLGDKPMTLDNIRIIDAELANAYKTFLDRDGANKSEKLFDSASLLRSNWHNEALVSNPKITGIFTDNIENLPEEYLVKAQEENLPIVIFDEKEVKSIF